MVEIPAAELNNTVASAVRATILSELPVATVVGIALLSFM
jgi:hypothetical protein